MRDGIAGYWDSRAKAYDKNVRPVIYSRREIVAWQKIFTGAVSENIQRIQDVGTGPGVVANLLADLGHEVTGIDPSAEMLNRAKENSKALHHHLKFIQADGEDLPFEDAYLDAVLSRYVMWTIPDPIAALGEWHRVLKPDGKVVIVDGRRNDGREKTLRRLLWKNLSLVLVVLLERRVPFYQDLDKNIKRNLWSVHASQPGVDVEMLKSLGFRNIITVENLDRKLMATLDYLKSSYCSKPFIVVGAK